MVLSGRASSAVVLAEVVGVILSWMVSGRQGIDDVDTSEPRRAFGSSEGVGWGHSHRIRCLSHHLGLPVLVRRSVVSFNPTENTDGFKDDDGEKDHGMRH